MCHNKIDPQVEFDKIRNRIVKVNEEIKIYEEKRNENKILKSKIESMKILLNKKLNSKIEISSKIEKLKKGILNEIRTNKTERGKFLEDRRDEMIKNMIL